VCVCVCASLFMILFEHEGYADIAGEARLQGAMCGCWSECWQGSEVARQAGGGGGGPMEEEEEEKGS